MLQGVITAIVSPMNNDFSIDYESLTSLIEFQISNGVSALVVIGSTGESALLTDEEKYAIIHHVIAVVKSRVKIIIGIGETATAFAVECTKSLNKINGIDYYMATVPSYVKPTQDGIYQHFATIAKISDRPIILYNVPSRTSCDMADSTTLKLATDFNNIVGLKDATADIARACYLLKHRPQGFSIYSGDDATSLAFVLSGGNGVISAVSNIVPNQYNRVMANAFAGDALEAIMLNNEIQELQDILFVESNPITVKWALFYLKIIKTPIVRLPLTTLTATSQGRIKHILDTIKAL